MLNVGYLVTTAPQDFADHADAPQLLLERSGVWVYERPNALPQAWIVSKVEVVGDGRSLSRIHSQDFDPLETALVPSAIHCTGTGEPAEVEMTNYSANRIEAETQGGGGLLVFSEMYYPGWQAIVDDAPAQLVRADYLLRALCVPAGEHTVTLSYDPPVLKVGGMVTCLALLVIVGAAVWPNRRRGDVA